MSTKKTYQHVSFEFDAHKVIKDAIKLLVKEECDRHFACERSQIIELDKAICKLQKDMRSMLVRLNRMESEAQ